jgi:hypothetical protein
MLLHAKKCIIYYKILVYNKNYFILYLYIPFNFDNSSSDESSILFNTIIFPLDAFFKKFSNNSNPNLTNLSL